LENLDKHVENLRLFNFNPTVAINRFDSDSEEEINVIRQHCNETGVKVSLVESWAKGSEGAVELAQIVSEAADNCKYCFKPLYDFEWTIEKKIETVATLMYGAKNVEYSLQAKNDIAKINELGLSKLPVCIAKTQKSLSDDQNKKGRPRDFTVKIREIEIAAGAGFVIPIAGSIMRMPGLPEIPSAELIDIDKDGNISGLF